MIKEVCGNCNKLKNVSFSEKLEKYLCKTCYKKLLWKPKLITCSRCKRSLPSHGKGLCAGCYNSTFHIERVRELNAQRYHNIPVEIYRELMKGCSVCGFDKIVEIHHLDHNHDNNSRENMGWFVP